VLATDYKEEALFNEFQDPMRHPMETKGARLHFKVKSLEFEVSPSGPSSSSPAEARRGRGQERTTRQTFHLKGAEEDDTELEESSVMMACTMTIKSHAKSPGLIYLFLYFLPSLEMLDNRLVSTC